MTLFNAMAHIMGAVSLLGVTIILWLWVTAILK